MKGYKDVKIRHFYIVKVELEGQNAPWLETVMLMNTIFLPLVCAVSDSDCKSIVILWLQILTHGESANVELTVKGEVELHLLPWPMALPSHAFTTCSSLQ